MAVLAAQAGDCREHFGEFFGLFNFLNLFDSLGILIFQTLQKRIEPFLIIPLHRISHIIPCRRIRIDALLYNPLLHLHLLLHPTTSHPHLLLQHLIMLTNNLLPLLKLLK